jgi:HPt (histidine-containing phosphotransfer) domain-containing protein
MAKIKEAYENRDFQVIKYLAHRIRPSLQNMCIDSIKEETILLENMAIADKDGEEMENLINKMSGVINKVSAKIKADYNV